MRRTFRLPLFLTLTLAIMLYSCEEVIILDLKNSEPRTVIDATLNATSGECEVRVSKSLGFYQSESAAKLSGVKVDLTNGSGTVRSLSEVKPGVYYAGGVSVTVGEVFRLQVTVSPDEQYTAYNRVPPYVRLDSLRAVRGFGDPRPTSPPIYVIKPKWKDPAGIENFYRFKLTNNGKPQRGSLTITNDEPFDGAEVDVPLYGFGFALGDTVRFEFQSIDSLSYSYFSQINDMARPSFVSATPYNPVGNVDNGALGYFGIFFSDVWNLIITPRP